MRLRFTVQYQNLGTMSNVMLLHGHLTDKELVEKVKAGNTSCFEVLVRRHSAALYRIARMYGFAHQEAEALMLEVFQEAFIRQHSFSGKVSYRIWLTKTMIHTCLLSREEREQDDQPASPACDTNRFSGRLEPCIEQMPLPLRGVYVLVEIDGYSLAETAQLLSTTVDGVRVRLEKAKASLRKSIRRWFQSSDVYPLDQQSCNKLVAVVMHAIKHPEQIISTANLLQSVY